jgi:branched-chain amino acid aminotransferase
MTLDTAARERWVWLDGRVSRAVEVALPALDPAARDAEALFETLHVRVGRPFLWLRHLERLARSAAELGFPDPPASETLEDALSRVLEASGLGEAVIRITLTRGQAEGPRSPGCWLEAEPLEARLWAGARSGDASAILASRAFEVGPLSRHKTTSRLAHRAALDEARGRGADEALLVSPAGLVLEGTMSSVFAVVAGEILTPPLSAGILPGVTRAWVLETCRARGLPAREEPLHRDRLSEAGEVFVTNAVQGAVPIAVLEGRPVPGRAIGLELRRICRTAAERRP